jgi:hypothetical protein
MTSNDQPIHTFIALRELFPECTHLVVLQRKAIEAKLITEDEAREMRSYAMRYIIPFDFIQKK